MTDARTLRDALLADMEADGVVIIDHEGFVARIDAIILAAAAEATALRERVAALEGALERIAAFSNEPEAMMAADALAALAPTPAPDEEATPMTDARTLLETCGWEGRCGHPRGHEVHRPCGAGSDGFHHDYGCHPFHLAAEATARAVGEALSVERLAEALASVLGYPEVPTVDGSQGLGYVAAALVAHLRGPR